MLGELEKLLLNEHVLMLATATMVVMWAIRKVWRGLDEHEWVRRLKPFYPIAICQGLIWLPGIVPEAKVGEKILIALWAAFLSMFIYQIYRRIIGAYGVKTPARFDKVSYDPKKPPEAEKAEE